jgi:hypothetical protein
MMASSKAWQHHPFSAVAHSMFCQHHAAAPRVMLMPVVPPYHG